MVHLVLSRRPGERSTRPRARQHAPVTIRFDKTPRKRTFEPWYTDFDTIYTYILIHDIVTHILKLPRKKGHLSHDIQTFGNNIHILIHSIVTTILKLAHNYCHDGRGMPFHTTHHEVFAGGRDEEPVIALDTREVQSLVMGSQEVRTVYNI